MRTRTSASGSAGEVPQRLSEARFRPSGVLMLSERRRRVGRPPCGDERVGRDSSQRVVVDGDGVLSGTAPEPLASSGVVGQGESPRRRGSRSRSGFAKHLVVLDPVVDDEPFHPRRDDRCGPVRAGESLYVAHARPRRHHQVLAGLGPDRSADRNSEQAGLLADVVDGHRGECSLELRTQFGPNAHVKEA